MKMLDDKKSGFGRSVVPAFILFFAVALACQISCSKKEDKTTIVKRIPVEVFKAKYKEFDLIETLTGEIRPLLEVNVYPKIPGYIIKNILVDTGKYVKKGAVIAEIETDTIVAKLEEAMAGLDSAKVQLEIAEKDYQRLFKLYEERAVPKQKLDHQESGYKLAQANVKSIEAKIKQLEILHKNHKVYAPIGGYISMKYVDQGALTSPAKPIVRISKMDTVKIVVGVPEKAYPALRKGTRAVIRLDAYPNKQIRGKVALISPTLDPATRTANVEIYIDNKKGIVRPGMFAHVELSLGRKKVLIVPEMALLKVTGTANYSLFVVNDGAAELRNVTLGLIHGEYSEIKSGIKRGDVVVQTGQKQLKDGNLVNIVNSSAEGA